MGFAHGCPPCDAYRADVTSVHRRSPRMSWRSRYAPLTGMRWRMTTPKPNFG